MVLMARMTRWLQCGSPMTATRRNVDCTASGLDGVTLMHVEVWTCPCGEDEVCIPHIEDLHQALLTTAARPVNATFVAGGWQVTSA